MESYVGKILFIYHYDLHQNELKIVCFLKKNDLEFPRDKKHYEKNWQMLPEIRVSLSGAINTIDCLTQIN